MATLTHNEEAAYLFLIKRGLNPHAAAGIVGNLMAESLENPANHTGDGGSSGGIAQWHLGRFTQLQDYAKAHGKPWTDFTTQLWFLWQDLQTYRGGKTLKDLENVDSAKMAAQIFSAQYEVNALGQTGDFTLREGNAITVFQVANGLGIGGGKAAKGGPGVAPGSAALAPVTGSSSSTKRAKLFPESYLDYMYHMGIPVTPETQAFAAEAAKKRWTTAAFDYNMYQQPWFKPLFPGIFDKQGNPIITPTEYNSRLHSYQGIARTMGTTIDRHQFGFLLQHNIGGQEFSQRLNAMQIINTNANDFKQFSKTLMANGLIKKPLTKEDLYKFVMKEAPATWYKVWTAASMRIAAVSAGLHIGSDITRNQIHGLIKHDPELAYLAKTPTGFFKEQQTFAKVAQDLKQLAPLSRLYQDHGLTASDLAQLEFGGPRAAEIKQRADQALASYRTQGMQQAHMVSGALETKLGESTTTQALKQGLQPGVQQPA